MARLVSSWSVKGTERKPFSRREGRSARFTVTPEEGSLSSRKRARVDGGSGSFRQEHRTRKRKKSALSPSAGRAIRQLNGSGSRSESAGGGGPSALNRSRARRAIEVLDELEVPPTRRRLIVNRHKLMSRVSTSRIAATLGLPVALKITSDHGTTLRAYRGTLVRDIARYKRIARDLRKLTDLTDWPRV